MTRAFIVSGVLSLGTVLVFGAALLASILFPSGGTISPGWNAWNGGGKPGFDVAVPVPAPAVMPGVVVSDGDVVVNDKP